MTIVSWSENFAGTHQDALVPWFPDRWATTKHQQDNQYFVLPEKAPRDGNHNYIGPAFPFDHGLLCEPPPATHTWDSWDGAYFLCDPHDATNHPPDGTVVTRHMMTVQNSVQYSVSYFQPDHMLDWSTGTAVFSFDVSTFFSSTRDWWDVWIMPYASHPSQPLEGWLPDLWGRPSQALWLRIIGRSGNAGDELYGQHASIGGERVENYDQQVLGVPAHNLVYYSLRPDSILIPSKTRRDRFEIAVSNTSIRAGWSAGNPAVNGGNGFTYLDTALSPALNYDRGVVVIGHHSYNPTKGQDPHDPNGVYAKPNTWHWSNFAMTKAKPYTIIRGWPERLIGNSPGGTWQTLGPFTFDAPAPTNAHLRFNSQSDWRPASGRFGAGGPGQGPQLTTLTGNRPGLMVSFNGGTDWVHPGFQETSYDPLNERGPATLRPGDPQDWGNDFTLAMNWWEPIPAGTTEVLVRSYGGWWGGTWIAQDFYILSENEPGLPPPPANVLSWSTEQTVTTATAPTGTVSWSSEQTVTTPSSLTIATVSHRTPYNTGAVITWTTGQLGDTQVEYGLTTAYGATTTLADTAPRVTLHKARLTGLAPSTLYHYRVRSAAADGSVNYSTDATFTTAATVASPLGAGVRVEWPRGGTDWYLHGANVPWYNWGSDFGGGASGGGVSGNTAILGSRFAELSAAGVRNLRWWVFPGTPSQTQITENMSGVPTGIGANVFTDLNAAVALAEQHNLYLHLVLFSGPEAIPWLDDPTQRAGLMSVLGTLFAAYANETRIMKWEFCNELDFRIYDNTVELDDVRACLVQFAAAVHVNCAAYATASVGFADGLPFLVGTGLDLYEAHWYDYMNTGNYNLYGHDYDFYVATYGLDGPLIVGEFYTPAGIEATNRLNYWYDNDYAGAFPWSAFPSRTNDALAIVDAAMTTFSGAHTDEGPQTTAPPVLASIVPRSAPEGTLGVTITCTGVRFTAATVVTWDGVPLVTTYVNATTVTAVVPAANLAALGPHTLGVQ